MIEEEINEGESNDDPLSIHQDKENKEEIWLWYNYSRNLIEPDKVNINDITCEDRLYLNNFNNVSKPLSIQEETAKDVRG